MLSKRAIELSMNFIVIIIITIIIFSFGILFIRNLSQNANDLTQLTLKDIDQRISDLSCDGSSRVCISPDTITIQKKKFDVFGIKIINAGNDANFIITVTYQSPLGYKKDASPITSPPLKLNPSAPRAVSIMKNDGKKIGIGVEVPANAVSGTYILDIDIRTSAGLYVPIQKLYVNVP